MRCFCRKIRAFHVKVVLLDEQELIQEVQDNSPGQEILDTVFRHLNLIETAYFGLRYLDASNQTHWLDPSKKIAKQLKGTDPLTLYFGVKFYAADPCKLLEEITRYQFFLQVKQDILKGRLPVSFDLAAELGSYVVQSEMGDYDPRRHSPGYVSEFRFLSNQTVELESRIAELHKGLVGQLPAVAELSYLDKVKWLEMYGVDLHPVLGEDNVEYFLGLTPSGIIVLRNKTKVGNYYWPRISKIYFKGRYFMLRVCDKNNDENTYGFETPSKPACKHLWRCCVEHHAFFRLLQVSPAGQDIFALGSRFRYSGRTEKQAQRDAQIRLRSPPQFTRTPSRRYQRRIVEGAQDAPKVEETVNNENIPPLEMKSVSIPQPAHSVGSLYRSTCSIPAVLPSHARPDSPRSTRSAPWTQPHARGLYAGASPRSVRSAGHNPQLLGRLARRSSSVESQSSNDSRSCKKHRHHRSRRGSDNDSELSKCSGKSHSHRRHRHRSHGTKRDSGSEQDQHHRHRHKSSSRHRHSGSHYELVDSEAQWKEVQRKQAEGGTGIQQATVVSNHRSGYMNSGMETESEQSYHHKRKHKKHRSRSRSPSDAKARLPDELKKHLEFGLIETEGMSESQLREIPYKVVETPGKGPRVKLSPSSKHRQRSPRRAKSCSTQDERCVPPSSGDSPPPPYSPPQAQNHHPGAPKSSSADDLDRIAETKPPPDGAAPFNGLADVVNKNSASSSASQSPAGSLRKRVGRDDNNINLGSGANSNLPRISTALGIPDYSSVNKGAHHHAATRAFSSALYDNPGFLLSKMNGHSSHGSGKHHPHHHHSSANSNNNYPASNINHEHSDSGLSAGSQDYSSYVADHPSDVPKYAQTTKLCTTSSQASFVSTGGHTNNSPLHNHHGHGQSRAYPFSSLRHHHHQPPPPLTLVNRHWHWERERDASSGTYRTLPSTGACNTNNNWSGSAGQPVGRRGGGPLYFQHHSSGSAGGAVMSSGWGKDPETIREDDESLEHTGSDSSPCKSGTAAAHTHTNGREVTHEMSTEL